MENQRFLPLNLILAKPKATQEDEKTVPTVQPMLIIMEFTR
jgi:hypothetical protein